jgi:hypothetical protein
MAISIKPTILWNKRENTFSYFRCNQHASIKFLNWQKTMKEIVSLTKFLLITRFSYLQCSFGHWENKILPQFEVWELNNTFFSSWLSATNFKCQKRFYSAKIILWLRFPRLEISIWDEKFTSPSFKWAWNPMEQRRNPFTCKAGWRP